MGKFNYTKNNFLSGELASKIKGDVDVRQFKGALELLEDMIVLKSGSARGRPGSRYMSADASINDGVIFPFIQSETDAWLVLLSNSGTPQSGGAVRIFKNDGSTGSFTGLAIPATTTTDPDTYFNFEYAVAGNTIFFFHPEIPPFIIVQYATGLFVKDDYLRPNYYFDSSLVLQSAGSPYLAVPNRNWVGSGYMYNFLRAPYSLANVDPTLTMTINTATVGTGRTLTAGTNFFTSDMVGAYIQSTITASTGVAIISAYTSATVVTVTVLIEFTSTAASDDWKISQWHNEYGYPRAGTFFEGRLDFGGNEKYPDTFWGSYLGNFYLMMQLKLAQDASTDVSGINYFGAAADTDPFEYSLNSNPVSLIQWMSGGATLEIGSYGGEYRIQGAANEALSRSSVDRKFQTGIGGRSRQPMRIQERVLFVSRDGRQVYSYMFNEANGSYVSEDLMILNDEIIRHGFAGGSAVANGIEILQMAHQKSRNVLWCLTSNNVLIGATINFSTGTVAWHRHNISGTAVVIQGIACIPNPDGSFDDLWLSVKRTVNGASVEYLEKIGDDFEHDDLMNSSTNDDDHAWFMDSAVRVVIDTDNISFTSGDVDTAADTIAEVLHGKITGTKCVLTTTGTVPGGLTAGESYFIVNQGNVNAFNLALTQEDAMATAYINLTSGGSGTHTLSSFEAKVFPGFSHLEGATVSVLKNGQVHADVAVSNGFVVTTGEYATELIAGLPYYPLMKPFPVEPGVPYGDSQGLVKRVDRVYTRLYKTYGGSIGQDENSLVEFEYDVGVAEAQIDLFSGIMTTYLDATTEQDFSIVIKQTKPLPITVSSLTFHGVVND